MTRCCTRSARCGPTSNACLNGWSDSNANVPNPWEALRARPHLNLVRARISEPARYYDDELTIVVRRGLLLCEERRHLWHELQHHTRRDRACHTDSRAERLVDKRAALWAMPTETMAWAIPRGDDWHEVADLLMLPESWVRFRWSVTPRWERDYFRAVNARRW